MRVPSFERLGRFMQVIAFFVCGMVVGSAIYSALQNDEVDRLILENYHLKDQLTTSNKTLEKIQEFRKGNVIQDIVPFIEAPNNSAAIDVVTEKELKKRLREDLSIFIGRSIYKIGSDSQLARNLLEKKIYADIGDNDYAVSVKTILVVDGVLQVWVEASIHRPT